MTHAAAYPIELVGDLTIANDRRVRVRPLRRCEDGVVRDLYGRLSPRTRYLRFFSQMPTLPESVVRLLTCVDYRRQLALLVELDTAEGAEVVALGSYAALDDRCVEVGLVVRDEWQRQGIGIALADRVMRAAQARGFDRFVAHTLWDNVVLRKLLNHVGNIISSTTRYGVCELTFASRDHVQANAGATAHVRRTRP
jgi:GNAT superfamily N-acetyltransferase